MKKKGISLLEVIVTLAILSIVGVAIVNMVIFSIKTTKNAGEIFHENKLLNKVLEIVRGVELQKDKEGYLTNEVIDTINGALIKIQEISNDEKENRRLKEEYIKKNPSIQGDLIRLFKVKDKNLCIKVEVGEKFLSRTNKGSNLSDNRGKNSVETNIKEEYIKVSGERYLVFLEGVQNNIIKIVYMLMDEDSYKKLEKQYDLYEYHKHHSFNNGEGNYFSTLEECKKELEELIADGKVINNSDIVKIIFERGATNHLQIVTKSLLEWENVNLNKGPQNQNHPLININVILENKTKYRDHTKVVPKYNLDNSSYTLNFNVLSKSKIEDNYIEQLGEKLEFSVEVLFYDDNYKFARKNIVKGYVEKGIKR